MRRGYTTVRRAQLRSSFVSRTEPSVTRPPTDSCFRRRNLRVGGGHRPRLRLSGGMRCGRGCFGRADREAARGASRGRPRGSSGLDVAAHRLPRADRRHHQHVPRPALLEGLVLGREDADRLVGHDVGPLRHEVERDRAADGLHPLGQRARALDERVGPAHHPQPVDQRLRRQRRELVEHLVRDLAARGRPLRHRAALLRERRHEARRRRACQLCTQACKHLRREVQLVRQSLTNVEDVTRTLNTTL